MSRCGAAFLPFNLLPAPKRLAWARLRVPKGERRKGVRGKRSVSPAFSDSVFLPGDA